MKAVCNIFTTKLLLSTGSENIITFFYNGLFRGNEKLKFLIAFFLINCVILVFLRILVEVFYSIHARMSLKKSDYEGYRRFQGYNRFKVYKRWQRGEYDKDDVCCVLYNKYERVENLLFLIWIVFMLSVIVAVGVSCVT